MKDVYVPEGYKSTDVGVIPEDWEVETVSKSFEICNNLRYPISQATRNKQSGKYPYYGPTKIQDYIDEYRVEGEYALIGEDGDHFLKWRDFPMTLLVEGKFNVNNHAHLIKGSKNLTQWFFYYFYHKDITPYLTRQGAGRYKLTKNALLQIPCALPPTIEEQKAIARVLSDVDELIRECDSLLAKKRDIKQGTMQQLLTSKKRLPGFSGEWEDKKLLDISTEIGDGIHSTPKYINLSEFHFINGNNLINGFIQITENTKCISQDEYYKHRKDLSKRTILISINGTIGNIALFENEKVILGKSAAYININKSVFKKYIFYFLQTHTVKSFFEDELTGTTIRNLSLQSIRNTPIQIPPTLPEQKAIAQILSDMDAEIEALEQKRDKYKAIKQGMMQELLTGKTRLIDN